MCEIKMGGIDGRQWSKGTPNNFYTQTHSPTEQGDKLMNIYLEGAKSALMAPVAGALTGAAIDPLSLVKTFTQSAAETALEHNIYGSNFTPSGTAVYGNNAAGVRMNMIQRNRGSIPGRKPR